MLGPVCVGDVPPGLMGLGAVLAVLGCVTCENAGALTQIIAIVQNGLAVELHWPSPGLSTAGNLPVALLQARDRGKHSKWGKFHGWGS
jgi:hypothetical protein